MVVRNNLRIIMAAKKKNIQDVSDATGLTRRTVSKLYHEISTQIRFDVLEKLCIYLECDISDLLYIEEEDS
ncbi:helix-turn-helix domain-containing protein [Gracilibacillus dipsosauri]|uniref:XRE family transcriptional regulator n=1 Tax=Gracilibacillus dipsosauri TaxID=178340 RepID=A0A317KTA6_9BACI|nr:helix-turn-helix transcriptional regulator [Gracilibacillus dipsosauri]PWU66556.1 XRE family transcriptional regulator [Gracilibacillus dipsosauri]